MKRFVFLMNGKTEKLASFISRSILVPLSSLWKNTAVKAFRAVCRFRYRARARTIMWSIRKRWEMLLDNMPARRELAQLRDAYAIVYDELEMTRFDYQQLYAKHIDMMEELRIWETKQARILNFIEKNWVEKTVKGGK